MRLFKLKLIKIQFLGGTSHISSAQEPQAASAYYKTQCSSGGQQKDIIEGPGSLDESTKQTCPAGSGVLEMFT